MSAALRFLAAVLVGAALIAGAVHIVAILLAPVYAQHDAFARLSVLGAVNATVPLPRAAPGEETFPFLDPALAASFCRFDLSGGPVRVRASVGDESFAALSFHTQRGAVFYALTDKAASRGTIDALVVSPEQLRVLESRDPDDEPSRDLRLVSATASGFVLMRAFSDQPSLYRSAERVVMSLSCAPEPL
jgi:uncharacterized membrane protein